MNKELKQCQYCGTETDNTLNGMPVCSECAEGPTITIFGADALIKYIEKREETLKSLIVRDAGHVKWTLGYPDRVPEAAEEDILWGSIMDSARRNRECAQRLDELAMLRAVFGLKE